MGKENDYFVVLLIWESTIHFFYFECDIFSATTLKDTTLGQKKMKKLFNLPIYFFLVMGNISSCGLRIFFSKLRIFLYIFWIVHVTIYIWVYSKLYNILYSGLLGSDVAYKHELRLNIQCALKRIEQKFTTIGPSKVWKSWNVLLFIRDFLERN